MRRWVRVAAVLTSLAALLALAWAIAPSFVEDPLVELNRHTPVRTWRDCRGQVLWYERTYDGEWRFPVSLSEIPEDVRTFTLNVEDSRFYEHGGVDYRSVARALVQDLCSFRILSGASTVSMQVAGLAYPKSPRFFLPSRLVWKFLQAARARKLERCHTKEEILEAYFNHLPYGGKIFGIRSAAAYFFGLKVSELTVAEASLLVGVPQAPNRLRPDRFPAAARRRQRLVLDSQVRKGRLSRETADGIFAAERLRYRDFTLPTPWEEKGVARDWCFLTNAVAVSPSTVTDCVLPVDGRLCADLKRILSRRTGDGVRDAAAVVMDVASGAVRGYVGTLDFDSARGGQVDAAMAVRSAGSTLKPFIYHEALLGGIITPDTPLLDAPLRYGGYAPGNFDGTFRGEVTATEALSDSLNTPVIRLVAALGEERVTRTFSRFGLVGSVKTNGLALALGSAGYRMMDIVEAYRRLAVGAVSTNAGHVASAQLSRMLRRRPLPGAPELDVSWKTGTSNNLRDAWCFAYTPDWVVGVWFGNKDGRSSPRLVGAEIAAPTAGEIMTRLYGDRSPPDWGKVPSVESWAGDVVGMAPRVRQDRTMILSPVPQTYRLSSDEKFLTLDLTCSDKSVYWFWNGTGLGNVTRFRFPRGRHRLVAVPVDPARPTATVCFTIGE